MAHDHDHDRPNERRAAVAFALTAGFMVVEAVGGFLSGSLALVADAVHMLTDAGALALAWGAFRMGRRPADMRRSYGYRRVEVLAAFVNGLAVMVLSAALAWEAMGRLAEPRPVDARLMLPVAALGLAVNLVVLRVLGGHGHANLNLRGAALHVLGDLLGSAGAVAAGTVILIWGWTPIDPLLSLGVAVLIMVGAVRLVRSAGHILLEGTPEGLDPDDICRHLAAVVPGVAEAHHLHAWSLTSGETLLTLHLRLAPGAANDAVLGAAKRELAERFSVTHSVIQIEGGACADPDDDCA